MTRVEETPVTNKSPPNEQERLSEPQRQQKLLHHLRTGRLNDVPPDLLLESWRDTRPFVKLAAGYDAVWQVFLRQISLIELIRTLIGFVAAVVGFMAALAALNFDLALLLLDRFTSMLVVLASPTWLGLFFQLVLPFLVGVVAFVVVLFLLDRLSLSNCSGTPGVVHLRV